MSKKVYTEISVLEATIDRISKTFDDFNRIYISFSGGKDSSVMMHLVLKEAIKRNRKVGILIIDLEAQYNDTIKHLEDMVEKYKDYIDLHWFCGELLLRNAVSNFAPRRVCWDEEKKDIWCRDKPKYASDLAQYDFYVPKMEFEELMVIFGEWYSQGQQTAAFIGIRADESLHRYKAIVSPKIGLTHSDRKRTTRVSNKLFNIYPIYDRKTQDIRVFHSRYPDLIHNAIYDKMMMAGVKISDQRLCQPYGDDQKKGLWLYHILEPDTWYKLLRRVSGVNSGSLYIKERGNMTGIHHIEKPDGHTRESFCNMLLMTMPTKTAIHYKERFVKFIVGWKKRGYSIIPQEAPHDLEIKCWAPSWKRMCRTLLKNDYWCKGLGQTQPLSDAYQKYKDIKKKRKLALDIQ